MRSIECSLHADRVELPEKGSYSIELPNRIKITRVKIILDHVNSDLFLE